MKLVTEVPRPKRHWFRFRLRTLLIVVTLFVLVLAIIREPHLAQHRAAATLEARGANVVWEGSGPFQNVVRVTFPSRDAQRRMERGLNAPQRIKMRLDMRVTSDDIALIRHFTQLRRLDLALVPFSDSDMVNLSRLNHLEKLDLSRKSITDDGLKHLQYLTNLRQIDVRGTEVTCDGLRHLSHLSNLTGLTLGSECRGDIVLKRVSQFSGLEELKIWTGGIPESEFVHLKKLPILKILWLSPYSITDVGIGHLGALTMLETLYIDAGDWLNDELLAKFKKAMPDCEIKRWYEPRSK